MENRTENRIKFFAKSAKGEQWERQAVLTKGEGKGGLERNFEKNEKSEKNTCIPLPTVLL